MCIRDRGQHRHGADVAHGDLPVDDPTQQQIHKAQQQGQSRGLTQRAADAADEHIADGEGGGQVIDRLSLIHIGR